MNGRYGLLWCEFSRVFKVGFESNSEVFSYTFPNYVEFSVGMSIKKSVVPTSCPN